MSSEQNNASRAHFVIKAEELYKVITHSKNTAPFHMSEIMVLAPGYDEQSRLDVHSTAVQMGSSRPNLKSISNFSLSLSPLLPARSTAAALLSKAHCASLIAYT